MNLFNTKKELDIFRGDLDLFESMFEDFDRIFGKNVFTNKFGDAVYQLEVPGFNKDNLEIELSDGILTIKGDRKVKDKNYAGHKKLYKRLLVGSDVEDASAKISDGILTITLKRTETSSGKKIELE